MSNGIDFVIGGKDKAAPAMSSVEKSLERLEKKTEDVGRATSRLANITSGLTAVYATLKGAMALIGGIDKINAAYDQQADAVKGLESALNMQGASVDVESSRLQKFASQMQALNGTGDEVTLGLMHQASMMGVATDQLDDMASATIGLSEATGKGLSESMKLMRQAAEGEFGAFGELMPQIKTMATNEEKLAAVMELSTRGLQAKADASNTVAGMSERASGAFGDLLESVGALLAPFRMLINQGIKTLSESLTTALVPAVEYANQMMENIGPLMDWLKEKIVAAVNVIIGAFTFFEVIVTNLDTVWAIMVSQAELYFLQMIGIVMHALTEVIPAYAVWFAENFVNLIRDGLVGAFTLVVNHVAKIIDAFTALWDFIASGGQTDILAALGEISGRSYLEGFVASTSALPEIMGRQITDREQELTDKIGAMGGALGDEFSRKMKDRIIGGTDGITGDLETTLDLQLNAKNNEEANKKKAGQSLNNPLNASESRLLTRGPASRMDDLVSMLKTIVKSLSNVEETSGDSAANINKIKQAAQNKPTLVPIP